MQKGNNLPTTTGNILYELRKERGFTQEDVAVYADVTLRAYTAWEHNVRDISVRSLNKLCDLYGVSADYILCRTKFRTPSGEDISNMTGLSDDAINALIKTKESASHILSSILTDHEYIDLMSAAFDYTHSHNVKLNPSGFIGGAPLIDIECYAQQVTKDVAIKYFGRILDRLYEKNNEAMAYDEGEKIVKEMFEYIHRYHDDTDFREALLKWIVMCQEKFSDGHWSVLKEFSPEWIYDNYYDLAAQLGIDLENNS